MNSSDAPLSTFYTPEPDAPPLDLRAIFTRYFYHWPFFATGVVLALLGAYGYNQWSGPSYEARASLLIEGDKKAPEDRSALQELDLTNSSKVVESEIEVLKSRKLMRAVVQNLGLGVVYEQQTGLGAHDLYGESPVQLVFLKESPPEPGEKHVLDIVLKDRTSFYVKQVSGALVAHLFNSTVADELGVWRLAPTASFGQYQGPGVRVVQKDSETVVTAYQKALTVELINKLAPAVSLQVKDGVARRATDVLGALIAAYNGSATSEKNKLTQNTLRFIDSRLVSLQDELNGAEVGVAEYRSKRGLTDISSQSQIFLENVQANDAQLNAAEVQLAVVQSIERYLDDPQPTAAVPTTLGITDDVLNNLVNQLAALQLQREKLLATTPAGNPLFKPVDSEIQATKSAIKNNVKNIKASLTATVRELQTFNSKFESSIKNIPRQERQLVGKKRQLTIKENLYTYLLQKREEVALSYASTLADARVVDTPYVVPSKIPKALIVYALAIALGMGLPASLLYLKQGLDGKVTTRAEIESALPIPIAAELPFDASAGALLTQAKTDSPLPEQIRSLRTRLSYLVPHASPSYVFLCTSGVSGEGKSFVSSNLAVALAHAGKKTVLVDLDLRRPQVSHIFNLPNHHAGVGDFLAGEVAWQDLVQPSAVSPHLSVIGSGKELASPADFLDGPRLEALITGLRAEYANIILDSPPLQLVTDALILARVSDATVCVVRQGLTTDKELRFIRELNEQNRLPKPSVVFNGIERTKYGYGYAYDSRYFTK